MGYAKHVGRVGTLAVALGIGSAVASTPGVAWAEEPEHQEQSVEDNHQNSPDPTKPSPSERRDPGEVIRRNIERAADDLRDNIRKAVTGAVRSSGGAVTSTHRSNPTRRFGNLIPLVDNDEPSGHPQVEDADEPDHPFWRTPRRSADQQQDQWRQHPSANGPTSVPNLKLAPKIAAPKPFSNVSSDFTRRIQRAVEDSVGLIHGPSHQRLAESPTPTLKMIDRDINQGTMIDTANPPQRIAVAEPAGPVVRIVSGLLAAIGLHPGATNSPTPPLAPQALLGGLELIRRELERTFFNKTPNVQANHNSLTVDQDESTTFTVPAFDADGDRLTYTVADRPDFGELSGPVKSADGQSYTYTYSAHGDAPTATTADDHVILTASDEGSGFHLHGFGSLFKPVRSHNATVRVNVDITPGNDAPVAVGDTETLAEGATKTIIVAANDTDADGNATINPASISITKQPNNGQATANSDGTVTYTHNGGETTTDSFTYTIKDSTGATSNEATVNITITPVNDNPVAVNDADTVAEGATKTIIVAANDTDADGTINPASVEITQNPVNGTFTVNANGTVTYTHDGGETATDSFTYTIKDNTGAVSNEATVNITITPVNDNPVAVNDTDTVAEGATKTINVSANDTDADGTIRPATITITQNPTNGTFTVNANGTVTYTHDGGETTTDSFTYTIRDNTGAVSNEATVRITITPVNDQPVASVDSLNLDEDAGEVTGVNVLANDTDVDNEHDDLVVTNAGTFRTDKGTVVLNADGSYTYTPDDNANGEDGFSYTVSDQAGGTAAIGSVLITITSVNDAPVSTAAPTVGTPDDKGVVKGLLNVTDADYDYLSYDIEQPDSGTVTVLGGSYTYTPKGTAQLAAYSSPGADYDSFTVTVTDGNGGTKTVTVENVPITPASAAVTGSIDLGGYPYSSPVQAPNGKYYQTIYGGPSNDVRVIEIDPANPGNPTIVTAGQGNPYGQVTEGSDGKLYQTSYAYSSATNSYTTYVAVLDPNDLSNPTMITVGSGRPSSTPYTALDGKQYINTYTGTSSSNESAKIVRIDPANPAAVTTYNAGPGQAVSEITIGADGKLYVTTQSSSSSSVGTVRVARIDPASPSNPTVFLAGTGNAYGNVMITSNGTLYQPLYTYNNDGYYANSVALLNQQAPNSPTVVSLPGRSFPYYSSSYNQFAPNGTGYFLSYDYANGVYTNYVTIVDPQDAAHAKTVNLGQDNTTGSIEVGPDGTAYRFRSTYVSNTERYQDIEVTTIRSDGSTSTLSLPGNNYSSPVFGTDGTRYQLTDNYNSSTGQQSNFAVTVIDPDNPGDATSITLPAAPVGSIIAGKNGTTYLALPSTGTSSANYQTPVLVFSAADPYHPTTVNLTGRQVDYRGVLLTAKDAGTLSESGFVVTDSGNGTIRLYVLNADDPTHPIAAAPQGTPVGSLVSGADGMYYLTVNRSVSGTTTAHVMAIDMSEPFSTKTVNAGPGAAISNVQIGPDGTIYQLTETSSSGYNSYVTIIRPDDLTHPVVVNTGPGRAYSSYLLFDQAGNAYLTTRTGGTSASDVTRLVRIDPADPTHPTIVPVGAGYPYSTVQFAPDGTVYQGTYTTSVVSGTTVYNNSIAVLKPQDLSHPTVFALPGKAAGQYMYIGPDGTATIITRSISGSGSTATYTNYLTVIDKLDPTRRTNVTLPGTNAYYNPQFGPDEKIYALTTAPTSTSGVSTTYLTIVDLDNPAQYRTVSLGDYRSASINVYSYWNGSSYTLYSNDAIAQDGTVWVDVTTPGSQRAVVAVHPVNNIVSAPITLPTEGYQYDRVIGTNGTLYEIRYTYDSTLQNYATTLTVVDPDDPSHSTTLSSNGYPPSTVQVAADGTAYRNLGYQYANGRYTTRIMIFNADDPYHPSTVEIPGYTQGNNVIIGDDGSASVVAYDGGTAKLVRIDTANSSDQSAQV